MVGLLVALALLAASLPAFAGQVFPFEAISPLPLPVGTVQIRLGASYADNDHLFFQERKKGRNVAELPLVYTSVAVGPNSELMVSYPFLYLDQSGQGTNYGSGDVELKGVFSLFGSRESALPFGLKLGVKLPNADDEKEFGTDETDFSIGVAAAHQAGGWTTLANLDLAILGHPRTDDTEQDDVFAYNLTGVYEFGDRAFAGIGVEGIAFSSYGNDRSLLRVGASLPHGQLAFDVGGGVRLAGKAPDWTVTAGISMQFGIRVEPPCPWPQAEE